MSVQTTWGPEFVTEPAADAEVHPIDEELAREADAEDDGLVTSPAPAPEAAPDRASLTRALRDLEAAKARVERDARRAQDEMKQKLVLQLLPAIDNLDRSLAAAQQNRDAPAVVEGVHLVRRQIVGILEGYGVRRIDARGKPFDPATHEAVSVVGVEPRYDGLVVDQLEPGYAMGERLLRPAKVVVGRGRYH